MWIGGTILMLLLTLAVGWLAGPHPLAVGVQLAIVVAWIVAMSVLRRRWRETDEARRRDDA